jgi:hypothetical protein
MLPERAVVLAGGKHHQPHVVLAGGQHHQPHVVLAGGQHHQPHATIFRQGKANAYGGGNSALKSRLQCAGNRAH